MGGRGKAPAKEFMFLLLVIKIMKKNINCHY